MTVNNLANRILTRCAALLLAGSTLTAVGCAPHYTDFDDFVVTPRQKYSQKPYVIEPPDSITIVAPNAPEIHNITQGLRPDGYITLHLLGDQLAAGKTPTILAMELQEKISSYYDDVKVQVRVSGFNSKFYYMAGETRFGPSPFTGRDTVFTAVMRSGLPRSSWPQKAAVIRPNEDGELIRRMSVNLKTMIETGDLSRNAVLEEGDIVFIPINPLAAFGVAIQNLLVPVQPAISAVTTPARVQTALP
ncbi:MAG: hypothetical protein CMJ18_10470 [Phycisphaeraceae bacterium]|nr:hypothetical protein [Phycisphaeraceae bacterium]